MYDRSHGIGASEIAAVLGISPYQTAWQVYARKKGLLEPQEETERMMWGRRLQRAIATVASEQLGWPHRWCDRPVAHRKRRWQFASPDAYLLSKPKQILEIKNVAVDQSGQWDREVSTEDGVPDYYAAQCHWQMSALELDACWIACLIGGNDFRTYRLERDAEIEAVLLEEGWAFVRDHIDANLPPPIDGSRAAGEYLRKRFPKHRDNIRQATPDEILALDEYASVRAAANALDARRDELENWLKEAVGDSEGLEWPRGKFTWKLTKDRAETDWEALARSQIKDFNKEEQAAFLEQFSHIKHGSRRVYFRASEIAAPIPIQTVSGSDMSTEQFGETNHA